MAARLPGLPQFNDLLAGWRGLGRLWVAVLVTLAIGGAVLQALGPPPSSRSVTARASIQRETSIADAKPAGHSADDGEPHADAKPTSPATHPGRAKPGPVADPDPAMLEAFHGDLKRKLPRIAADGRMPMTAYAAGFDPTAMRPRVGILIAGIGMSEAASLAAMKNLPAGVTLAISPYATEMDHMLEVARTTGHEYLLSVPMEPLGYPVNDPDDRYALMTSLPSNENLERLRAVLTRLTGYVGVTNALGQLHGERLTGVPDQLDAVLQEVAHRGLLFVDARPGQPVQEHAWNRPADILIDGDPVDAASVNQQLDALTHFALDRGSALGIVSVPRPVTLERVAAWTRTLADKGLALAPVSALALPPTPQDAEK